MKRLFLILVSAILCMMFTACTGPKNGDNGEGVSADKHNTKVEQFGKQGKIYGHKISLGTSIEDVKNQYHYGDESYWANPSNNSNTLIGGDEAQVLDISGDDTVRMISGNERYYYLKKNEANGVAFMSVFGDAYGFKAGISSPKDVKDAVGKPTMEGKADEKDLFFFVGGTLPNAYKVSYTYGNYVVSFFFSDDTLSATSIYNKTTWISDTNTSSGTSSTVS